VEELSEQECSMNMAQSSNFAEESRREKRQKNGKLKNAGMNQ